MLYSGSVGDVTLALSMALANLLTNTGPLVTRPDVPAAQLRPPNPSLHRPFGNRFQLDCGVSFQMMP